MELKTTLWALALFLCIAAAEAGAERFKYIVGGSGATPP